MSPPVGSRTPRRPPSTRSCRRAGSRRWRGRRDRRRRRQRPRGTPLRNRPAATVAPTRHLAAHPDATRRGVTDVDGRELPDRRRQQIEMILAPAVDRPADADPARHIRAGAERRELPLRRHRRRPETPTAHHAVITQGATELIAGLHRHEPLRRDLRRRTLRRLIVSHTAGTRHHRDQPHPDEPRREPHVVTSPSRPANQHTAGIQ